jgi:hypothetical protein
MMKHPLLRDLLIALSAANLCFLRVWDYLLSSSTFLPHYSRIEYLSAIPAVLVLAGFFWLFLALGRKSVRGFPLLFLGWLPVVALVLPLNYVRTFFPDYLSQEAMTLRFGGNGVLLIAVLGSLLLLCIMGRWHRQLLAVSRAVLLVLGTFVCLTFPQAIWHAVRTNPAPAVVGAEQRASQPRRVAAQRVLWLIFDEWDYRLTFLDRAPDLQLPEIDRFASESVSASNAYPPAEVTLQSMPAVLTGRLVESTALPDGAKLEITYAGEEKATNFLAEPTLFSLMRSAGFSAAVVGWYFPYCRELAPLLTRCTWQPKMAPAASRDPGLVPNMLNEAHSTLPWAPRSETVVKYENILADAKQMANDAALDLTLVHWPIPHHPPIYDRKRHGFSTSLLRSSRTWYLDNLALVDATVGELRREMKRGGTWDRTAVLLTADHSWRSSTALDGKRDFRVPFLLKLAGQKKRLQFDRPFNTVLTSGLLLAILRGDVSTPDLAAQWLEKHSGNAAVGSAEPR